MQSSYVIANNARKQQKLFVQGHNLEVHDVMKYTRKLVSRNQILFWDNAPARKTGSGYARLRENIVP